MSEPTAWTVLHRPLAETDSTNTYLLAQARTGAPAGTVVTAQWQSAGRGRLGRSWEAPPGTSLLASVLLRPLVAPEELQLCSAAVALAALEACQRASGVRPGLKWPNDLVVGERKLAGVLGESDPAAPGGRPGSVAVVVGLGLNVRWPGPPGAGGTSLEEEAGRPLAVAGVRQAFLAALPARARQLETPDGRRELARDQRAQSATLGRRVRVLVGTEELVGTAVELTAAGELVLDTGAGRRQLAAGDVVHLRPAPGPA